MDHLLSRSDIGLGFTPLTLPQATAVKHSSPMDVCAWAFLPRCKRLRKMSKNALLKEPCDAGLFRVKIPDTFLNKKMK